MTRYVSMRMLIIIPTLFLTLMIVFLLGYLGPIDPVDIKRAQWAAQGIFMTQEELAAERANLGLDKPFFVQFGAYLGNLIQGSLAIPISTPPRSGRVSRKRCRSPAPSRWAQ